MGPTSKEKEKKNKNKMKAKGRSARRPERFFDFFFLLFTFQILFLRFTKI